MDRPPKARRRRVRARTVQRSGRHFGADDRGHLLVLTGVLLVLGFVTLGATLVQLNANEDKAVRAQREPITDTVNELVESFRASLRGATMLGNTNITEYMERSVKHEGTLNDAAGRIGLYANATLVPDPDLGTFLTEENCVGYDAFASKNGVIIGFEKATLQETIVGAVYRMNFTDGRQMISMDHYVKIFDCTPQYLYSFPVGVTQNLGDVTDLKHVKDPDDDREHAVFREELSGDQIHVGVGLPENIDAVGWNNAQNIILFDGFANRPSPPVLDYLKFDYAPTAEMDQVKAVVGDVVLNEFKVNVVAKNNPGSGNTPGDPYDYLRLSVYRAGEILPYKMYNFTDLTTDWTNYTVEPPSPSGNPEWTYEEFDETRFELTLQLNGLKDLDNPIQVKWAGADIEFAGPVGYLMDLELQWEEIPTRLYGNHVIEMQYRIPGGSTEELQLQMWNTATGAWQNVGPTLPTTGANWEDGYTHTIEVALYDNIADMDESMIRIVDTQHADLAKGDRDILHIDYLAIRSMFVGASP